MIGVAFDGEVGRDALLRCLAPAGFGGSFPP